MDERQLRWVNTNRQQRRRPETVGVLAQVLLGPRRLRRAVWRQRVLTVINEEVGADLAGQISQVSVRAGALTLEVCEPAVLYHLRVHWEQRLLEVARAELPEAGVSRVRFVQAAVR